MTPNRESQTIPFSLIVMGGLGGYRLAYAGGAYFSIIRDESDPDGGTLWFASLDEAHAAKKAADEAAQVFRIRCREGWLG